MRRIFFLSIVLLSLLSLNIAGQEREITGKVTDSEGIPIPGAAVLAEGTTKGTITDFDGNYFILVPDGVTHLVFSFLGMQNQRIEIGDKSVIDVTLISEEIGLEEVVVTAMGVKRKDKTIGYAYSKIDPEKTARKSEPDIVKSLQGKVAGVNISSSSGSPGSATRITIRGNSSFLGNNQPLFVVDGIPYSNQQFNTTDQLTSGGAYSSGIATLDPNNIASITVLKGAAAAALYGSRAANGVVLINTKTGSGVKDEKFFTASLSSSFSMEEVSNLPDYQNTYGAGVNFDYTNANGSWGPRFDQLDSIPLWDPYQEAFPARNKKIAYEPHPNNVKNLFNTGHILENSISVSGGNEHFTLNGLASVLNHKSFIPHSYFDKYNVDLGGTYKFEFGLTASGNFSYTKSEQRGGLFGSSLSTDAGQASSFASTLFLARDWDMSLPYEDPETGASLFPVGTQADNPLWSWEHNGVISNLERMVWGVNLGYEFTSWLNVEYNFGMNSLTDSRLQIIDKGSRAYSGKGAIIDDDIVAEELESNFRINVSKVLNDNWTMRVVLGHNVNERTIDRKKLFGLELIEPEEYDIDNTQDVSRELFYQQKRIWGVYTDLSFDYKNFLFLNATGRNDWSSTLPVSSRSYFYPSFAASFLFTEGLNIESNFLTTGKIRASWARVGNDADPYKLQTIYFKNHGASTGLLGSVEDNDLPFLGQEGMTTSDEYNDAKLTPEFTNEIEIGTIFEFFGGRINLDLAVFDKTTTDQLAKISLPASSGYQQKFTNFGKMNNRGVEFSLDLTPVEKENGLRWNIFTTFSKVQSKVVSLAPGIERILVQSVASGAVSPVLEPGQPYGILRGTVSARDNDGNLLIDPSTGLLITANEFAKIGDPNPDFLAGLTNTFNYKGLSLSFLLDYKHGGDLYSYTVRSYLGRGVTKDTEDREKTWVIPGYYGDPNTGEPKIDESGNKITNTTRISTNDLYFGNSFALQGNDEWSVYDATVLRLREVTLSYSLPGKWMGKLPLEAVSLSLTGRNLWYLAPHFPEHTNFDPEVNTLGASNAQGIDYVSAPSTRRYGINLKISF